MIDTQWGYAFGMECPQYDADDQRVVHPSDLPIAERFGTFLQGDGLLWVPARPDNHADAIAFLAGFHTAGDINGVGLDIFNVGTGAEYEVDAECLYSKVATNRTIAEHWLGIFHRLFNGLFADTASALAYATSDWLFLDVTEGEDAPLSGQQRA